MNCGKEINKKQLKKFTGFTSNKRPVEGLTIKSIKGPVSDNELEWVIDLWNEFAKKSTRKVNIEITLY